MMVRREVTGVKKPRYTTVVRGELEEFLINNKELLKEEMAKSSGQVEGCDRVL